MGDPTKVRKFWGWGYEGEGPTRDQQEQMAKTLAGMFDLDEIAVSEPPKIDELELPEPRLEPPASLVSLCTTEPAERAGHTYGKSFRDVARAFRRDFAHPPDIVVAPRTEADVADVLDWCAEAGAAAIPYGGGSSVVGGVECDVGDTYRGAVSVDLRHLDQVLDIDRATRAARIQAGVYGPALEDQLRPHGVTLRHFPQSFECSTLGGWIATRSGGHYATLYTHIDDFVESLRVVTPRGVVESRRLPGSGAGPSPDRLFLGSEGILGVITEAWMRLQDRPRFRASAAVRFSTFEQGVQATRALAQSGLHPSNCRLLDATEAMVTGADDGSAHLLLIAFESADHPLDAWIARAAELARDHGGDVPDNALHTRTDDSTREGSAGAWRSAFLRAPYTRDALVAMGMVNETFETAITWDRFDALYGDVMDAVRGALVEIGAPKGVVTCRFTHVYPDGPAPYFTVIAPGRPGAQLEQWAVVKDAASEMLVRHGATITHHHAVGRDHRRWYDRQRPPLFAETLRSTKATLDPHATLNPGVLIDPVKFEAVVFDLGGVVFPSPLDVFRAYERDHGLPHRFLSEVVLADPEHGAWSRLERGEVNFDEFCDAFDAECAAHGGIVSARELMDAVRVGLDARPEMVTAIGAIRRHGLKTAALTNNWTDDPARTDRASPTGEWFDVMVESAIEGLRKPDPRIYALVCERLAVTPPATVFLDDLGANLKPARELGMTTIKVAETDVALAELEDVLGFELDH